MGDCMYATLHSALTSIPRLHTRRDSNQKTWLRGESTIASDESVVPYRQCSAGRIWALEWRASRDVGGLPPGNRHVGDKSDCRVGLFSGGSFRIVFPFRVTFVTSPPTFPFEFPRP
jgi:hypothetical protein